MFVGGTLIRQFDGFRRLCAHAAEGMGSPLMVEDDMALINRTLAALGGPPAVPEVRGQFQQDGLALLLLFLLTQEYSCRVGLLGEAGPVLVRLKGLVHVLGHGMIPTLTGGSPLALQEVVRELGATGAALRPLIRYDQDGEPVEALPSGGAGLVRVGPEGGPYTLAVRMGPGAGLAPLAAPKGPLHPAVLMLGEA